MGKSRFTIRGHELTRGWFEFQNVITSAPTKYGAGITLYGDSYDFKTLHDTIHKIAGQGFINSRFGDFILGLAYDVRKAFEGAREQREFELDDLEKVKYWGVRVLWPIFLTQLGLLRHYAGFGVTNHRDQACLYALEDCAITSLLAYDAQTGKLCAEWLLNFPSFPDDYHLDFVSYCSGKFTTQASGKRRFKRLPDNLRMLALFSPEYKRFCDYLQTEAKKQGIDVHQLEDRTEWPDFRW